MHIEYNGIEIDDDQYNNIANAMFDLKLSVCQYFGKSPSQLRWRDYWDFINEKNSIEIEYVDLPSEFMGKTKKDSAGIIMILNSNDRLNSGRKHFTFLHELSHVLLHLKELRNYQTFYYNVGSDTSSDLKEIEANIGASELLMDTTAIEKNCLVNPTFSEMRTEFDVSNSALQMRLQNLLVFKYNVNFNTAKTFINGFRYRGQTAFPWYISRKDEIEEYFINFLDGSNLDTFKNFVDETRVVFPTVYNNLNGLSLKLIYQEIVSEL